MRSKKTSKRNQHLGMDGVYVYKLPFKYEGVYIKKAKNKAAS